MLDNIGIRRDEDGNLIVWEGSDVVYTLLDEEWSISELNYDPATGESVVTLNRPLTGVPMLWGHLPHPEIIMEESLQDTNGRCVFVALAKFMDLPEGVVEGELHEIFDELHTREEKEAEPWCGKYFAEVGVTPAMLIRYAVKSDMGVVALHGSTAYHRTLRKETHNAQERNP